MTNKKTWANRIALLLVWVLVTAGVAFFVARNAATGDEAVDVTAPLPPVALDQRATVSLEEQTIVPIISANAIVMRYDGTWMLEAPATSDDVAYRLLDPPVASAPRSTAVPLASHAHGSVWGKAAFRAPRRRKMARARNTGRYAARRGAGSSAAYTVRPMAFVPMGDVPGSRNKPDTPDTGVQPSTAGVTMRCEIPDDVRVAAGMTRADGVADGPAARCPGTAGDGGRRCGRPGTGRRRPR